MNKDRVTKSNLIVFNKTVDSLSSAFYKYRKSGDEFVKDSCLHRFKLCYRLAHTSIQRYLEVQEPDNNNIKQMTFQQIITRAYSLGLVLNGWESWKIYRYCNSRVKLALNANIAEEILANIPSFLGELNHLYGKLRIHI